MENAASVFEAVCQALQELGLVMDAIRDAQVAHVGVRVSRGVLDVYFRVLEKPPLLEVTMLTHLVIPEQSRASVAELITRANYGLLLGYLSLDMRDGTLCWHASMPLEGGHLGSGQVGQFIIAGAGMIDRYLPAVNRLVYADDLSPAEAIAEVDMASPSPAEEKRKAS